MPDADLLSPDGPLVAVEFSVIGNVRCRHCGKFEFVPSLGLKRQQIQFLFDRIADEHANCWLKKVELV